MTRYCVAVAIALFSTGLLAEPCGEPGNIDAMCVEQQWAKEISKADKQLNAVYQKLLKSIENPETKADLVKAQRAWVTYYQLDCKARYDLLRKGSSLTKWEVGEDCRLKKLQHRIAELQEHCGKELNCRSCAYTLADDCEN